MTVTKNEDGTFSVTFTQRQLELVVARLGLNPGDGPLDREEFANYETFSDAVEAVGVNVSPLKAGIVRFSDLTPGEQLIATLAGEGPYVTETPTTVEQSSSRQRRRSTKPRSATVVPS